MNPLEFFSSADPRESLDPRLGISAPDNFSHKQSRKKNDLPYWLTIASSSSRYAAFEHRVSILLILSNLFRVAPSEGKRKEGHTHTELVNLRTADTGCWFLSGPGKVLCTWSGVSYSYMLGPILDIETVPPSSPSMSPCTVDRYFIVSTKSRKSNTTSSLCKT